MDDFYALIPLIAAVLVAVVIYSTAIFIVSRIIKRNDIADVAWGPGIALVALVSFYFHEAGSPLVYILTALSLLWAARLSFRIYRKNAAKKEDARYLALSRDWGKWFVLRSYLQVFLLQGFLMAIIGAPFLVASVYANGAPSALAYIGILIWVIGFIFEAVGDYQLDRFIENPNNRGRIMRYGLWQYSRHPNYFGEVSMWWGIFLMVVTLPSGLFAIVSPLMITYLILKVSGIPMLEKQFEGNQEFEEYKLATNAFFPWFPKRP